MAIRIYTTAPGGGGGGGSQTLQQVVNAGNTIQVGPTVTMLLTDGVGNFNLIDNQGLILNKGGTTNDPNAVVRPDEIVLEDNQVNSNVMTRFGWLVTDSGGNTNRGASADIQINGVSVALKPTINVQTGTSYILALTDDMNYITANNAATQTYTVPTNASVPFRIGATVQIIGIGSGTVKIQAAGGVTIGSKAGNLAVNGQNVGVSLVKIDTNTWELLGDLSA